MVGWLYQVYIPCVPYISMLRVFTFPCVISLHSC
jgi:hypothetical protein